MTLQNSDDILHSAGAL